MDFGCGSWEEAITPELILGSHTHDLVIEQHTFTHSSPKIRQPSLGTDCLAAPPSPTPRSGYIVLASCLEAQGHSQGPSFLLKNLLPPLRILREFPGGQWLGLWASTAGGTGSSSGELRSHMPCGVAKINEKKKIFLKESSARSQSPSILHPTMIQSDPLASSCTVAEWGWGGPTAQAPSKGAKVTRGGPQPVRQERIKSKIASDG